MPGLFSASGTRYTAATAPTTPVVDPDPLLTLTADVYTDARYPSEEARGATAARDATSRRLWKKSGATVRTSALAALFPTATITGVLPAVGPAAGGTAVTITGTNLDGVTAVSLGGVVATSRVNVNSTTITCVTGAHAAGAVTVIAADDSGNATLPTGFTYE